MPAFSREISFDNYSRTVVKFVYSATGSVAAYSLTGGISPSELYGWKGATGGTSCSLGISKAFWSLPIPGTAPTAVEISWGQVASVTGTPALYLNNGGYVNFAGEAIPLNNPLTGVDRLNSITLRNTQGISGGDGLTIILELDKNQGFGLTGYVGY